MPHDFDRKTENASCCRKICAASSDASLLFHEFLTKHETTVVPRPPYSPDLAPADLFLFPKWKSSLKGHRFQTVEEIEENSIRDLRAVPQNAFQDRSRNGKNVGSGVSRVEGSTLRVTSWINFKWSNKFKKFGFFMDCTRTQYIIIYLPPPWLQDQLGHIYFSPEDGDSVVFRNNSGKLQQ